MNDASKKITWKPYLFFIGLSEAVGVIAGLLTRGGMEQYKLLEKPALTPPDIVFPIVWSILYALMGISAARIYLSNTTEERNRGLRLFFLQLVINFFWSIIFFNLQAFGFAFIWLLLLWILIVLMIRSFVQTNRLAAYLQIPYLIWVSFALYLNLMVWILNR